MEDGKLESMHSMSAMSRYCEASDLPRGTLEVAMKQHGALVWYKTVGNGKRKARWYAGH